MQHRDAGGAGQAQAAVLGVGADRFERADAVDLVVPALAVGRDVTGG
ncbi:hypothetical protein Q3Y56_15655 [Streptomyces sp. XD-27]|nr:hypothetical protein [Streptomyces sp. XD-27]WKX71157.1 hypothetical protein Q3Y56_15655 [Streptomyces sp. XD-27]